jgi:hypothetical protein
VKFVYCAKCRSVQKWAWPPRYQCPICGEDVRIITIKPGIYSYLMYALSGLALVFVLLRVWNYNTGLGDLDWVIIFGSLIIAFICSYLENERGYRELDRMLKTGRR